MAIRRFSRRARWASAVVVASAVTASFIVGEAVSAPVRGMPVCAATIAAHVAGPARSVAHSPGLLGG